MGPCSGSRGAAGLDGPCCWDPVTSGPWLTGLTSRRLVLPVTIAHGTHSSALAAHPSNTVTPSLGQTWGQNHRTHLTHFTDEKTEARRGRTAVLQSNQTVNFSLLIPAWNVVTNTHVTNTPLHILGTWISKCGPRSAQPLGSSRLCRQEPGSGQGPWFVWGHPPGRGRGGAAASPRWALTVTHGN